MSDRPDAPPPVLGPGFDEAEVALELGPDGRIRFEVLGVPGEGCEELERVILAALDSEVVAREHGAAFYQRRKTGLKGALQALLGRK